MTMSESPWRGRLYGAYGGLAAVEFGSMKMGGASVLPSSDMDAFGTSWPVSGLRTYADIARV